MWLTKFGLTPADRSRVGKEGPAMPTWGAPAEDTPSLEEFLAANPSGPGGAAAWEAYQKKWGRQH
jgi:hypothetical protein